MLPALASHETDEWYTPAHVLEVAHAVLGGVDLDPASCQEANTIVGARAYYSAVDNGLSPLSPWMGRVWCNPPYSLAGLFVRRIVDEVAMGNVASALLLVNAATEAQWFAPLWAQPICFPRGRIQFVGPGGKRGSSPTKGSALVYFGADVEAFVRHASRLGPVVPGIMQPPSVVQMSLFEGE